MVKFAGEEMSKQMKTCVAGRAICPELAAVIANTIHERRIQACEFYKVARVGTYAHTLRSTGLAEVSD